MIEKRCYNCNKLLFKVQQVGTAPSSNAIIEPIQFIQIKCTRCKIIVEIPFSGRVFNAAGY